jgi:hypothetical protein
VDDSLGGILLFWKLFRIQFTILVCVFRSYGNGAG